MNRNDKKGFALILMLALLPLLTAGLLMIFAMMGFMQTDLALKHACRSGGLQGQRTIKPLLGSLLALNPLAQTLRLQKIKAQQELILATNPPALLAATAKLGRIQQKQKELDMRQKQLIRQSNMLLDRSHSGTRRQILKEAQQSSSRLFFLETKRHLEFSLAPKLAVRPDSSDLAPTYSPVDDFESEQALAHRWQYKIALRPPFRNLLPAVFHFDKACAVTLTKESSEWKVKITKGRFSLKSVW